MSLRILLVERDATTADLLVPSLERKGYEVSVVRSQRQALSSGRALPPDLLIVDVASFGGNGHKVCANVRARLAGIPTVLLLQSSYDGALSQADAFMTQPFTSRKLLYRIKLVAESLDRTELCVGPLALDPATRVLQVGENTTQLRPKEAALLALFLQNPGKVLTRPEIIKEVWETDYIGDTRTLSVHVRWLRQKIEQDPNQPRFLRTVRGVGYRFEVPAEDQL